MSKVDTILNQLKDIAANPKKAMDDYKNETGKGAIGIMPLYAPEELVYATGYTASGACARPRSSICPSTASSPAIRPTSSSSIPKKSGPSAARPCTPRATTLPSWAGRCRAASAITGWAACSCSKKQGKALVTLCHARTVSVPTGMALFFSDRGK